MAAKNPEQRYRAALKDAEIDLENAVRALEGWEEEGEELKDKVANLRRIVAGLADYCGVPVKDWRGITESCTEVMNSAQRPLDTKQVIEALAEVGVTLSRQKNPAASVTSVLNRLAAKHAIKKRITADGILWIGPNATDWLADPPPIAG